MPGRQQIALGRILVTIFRQDVKAHDSATSGVLLALVVDSCDAEYQRLKTAGLTFLLEPQDEPWGQRRLQIAAPDGVVVEIIEKIPPNMEWLAQNS